MAYETYIKRTIYVAECPTCHEKDIRVDNPPRERHCNNCDTWVPYVEESFLGPEFGNRKQKK